MHVSSIPKQSGSPTAGRDPILVSPKGYLNDRNSPSSRVEMKWQFLSFLSASHSRGESSQDNPCVLVSISVPQIPALSAAEKKLVAQSEAAVSHGRAAMQFPAELWSQPSTISLVFQSSKEVLAPGRLISFGTELL